jgi:hypothetical protein
LLEERTTNKNLFDKDSTINSEKNTTDMKNLAGEINIQMKDLEGNDRTSFNKSLEIDATRNNTLELQIESKIDNINKELLSKIESIEN